MSKELEALNNILISIDELGMQPTIPTDVKEFDFHKAFEDEINIIKQALQAPSREDVCKALSEYFKEEVDYENNLFNVYDCKNQKYWGRQSREISLDELYDVPHIITMIGKFYGSESESNENI